MGSQDRELFYSMQALVCRWTAAKQNADEMKGLASTMMNHRDPYDMKGQKLSQKMTNSVAKYDKSATHVKYLYSQNENKFEYWQKFSLMLLQIMKGFWKKHMMQYKITKDDVNTKLLRICQMTMICSHTVDWQPTHWYLSSFRKDFHDTFWSLDASTHLYKRVCPSVFRSVRPSVRPSLRPSVRPSLRPSVRPSVRPSRVFFNEPIMGENGRKWLGKQSKCSKLVEKVFRIVPKCPKMSTSDASLSEWMGVIHWHCVGVIYFKVVNCVHQKAVQCWRTVNREAKILSKGKIGKIGKKEKEGRKKRKAVIRKKTTKAESQQAGAGRPNGDPWWKA